MARPFFVLWPQRGDPWQDISEIGSTAAAVALGTMLALGATPGFAAEKLAVARSSASGFTFDPLNIGIEKGITPNTASTCRCR